MSSDQGSVGWAPLARGADVVGYVRVDGFDNFHVFGRFRAGPAFSQYEALLAELAEAWRLRADAGDRLDALLEEIDALGLQLIDPTGGASRIRDFQLDELEQVHDPAGVLVGFKFIRTEPGTASNRRRK